MFTVEEREETRRRLLELAEADDDVLGAAITGSHAAGKADEWSDIDLALSIRGDLTPALERWTGVLERDFGALNHWDLPWATSVYRVFLLPHWLEVDISFTPAADFGPRGPNWQTVFGETATVEHNAPVPQDDLVGLGWHHLLHARMCIARGKPWQAEWLISGARDHVLALGCLRLGLTTRFAKGVDALPRELTEPAEEALVRSLDNEELVRALAAAIGAYRAELQQTDAELAGRLGPLLDELLVFE
jgi:predicted nucleotidyltransferase